MYTQCPECLTIFEVDEDAVQASLGIVHCGHCARRFDALLTLSDTLPAEPNAPLAEQHPVELVPTLTETVPPSTFQLAAKERNSGGDAAPVTLEQKSEGAETPAEPVADEERWPGTVQPPSGDSTDDWFADFEIELAPSLTADATGLPRLRGVDYTWQVNDLSAQSRFPGQDIPVTLAGTGTSDASRTIGPETSGGLQDGSAVPQPPEETAPSWLGEFNDDTPITDDLAPDDAGPASVEPAAALPTRIPQARDVTDSNAAETPDATATEMEFARSEVESDPVSPPTPVYVRPRERRAAGVIWLLGCLLLALLLAAQLAWIERAELFRNPATHTWAARVCQVVACHLPPIRAIAKLELVSRDVRPDPRAAGALMVTATVRNDATFRQPWPVVVVELTDLDNNPVAMRRFRPAEYMPDPARRATGIAPGATAAIAFEVTDPGKRAVAFQFSFE